MNGGLQLSLDGGLDPVELAAVPIDRRIKLYEELGLDRAQREAAEAEVRRVIRAKPRLGRGA